MNLIPPKWADRFLRWYCHPDLLEEIQGDTEELFYRRAAEEGEKKAKRKYIWDVIRFFRWSNLKKSNKLKINSLIMFNSYLKIGFRNLSKNWVISIINIFGLALAVGSAITVFIFVDLQHNMDSFHSKKDRIYALINHVTDENGTEFWATNPFLLGPDLKDNHTIVENVVRAKFDYGNMRYENKVFRETITYVDSSIFNMFDFQLASGARNALSEKQNMVISSLIAEKYFGEEDPIGQVISIKFNGNRTQSYAIAGVLEKYSANTSFRFDVLVPVSNIRELRDENVSWDWLTSATFVQLNEGHSPSELDAQMDKYITLHNEATSDWKIEKFEFVPLDQFALRSYEIRRSIAMGGHPAGRLTIGIISFILLALACFNYMNIAVASAAKRLKEIALRKVMGGNRTHIVHQFMTENVILCAFSMALGTLLSYYLFVPGFNMMLPFAMPFTFSSFRLGVLFFGGLLVVIGLASGSYPAFYISKFQPVSIFKGNQKLGGKNLFSKVLLSMQLILAFMTVVACFVFSENGRHFNAKDWGYNPNGLFTVVIQNEHQYNELSKLAQQIPAVEMFTASNAHINSYDPLTTVENLGVEIKSNHYRCAPNYPQTMNLRLMEGKYFDERQNAEASNLAIIDDVFVKKMGWLEPLNQTFTHDSSTFTVIGVVESFYLYGFHSEKTPAFFTLTDPKDFLYFTFKVPEDQMFDIDDQVREAWFDIAPNDPFNRKFQMFAFDGFYQSNDANIALMGVVSFFAIILGCMGLFGLLSFNLQRRMKEFGVRKVLGAERGTLIKLANKEYLWVMVVSFFLGAPLGYLLMDKLLNLMYQDPLQITAIPFILSIALMAITVGLTVTGQILNVTKVNPAEILRSE
ncbi:MAG: ABC transporter permease [Reichenbachiella sp.]|uniref:ABC transporter permease n=1 Tax=Reichenbachiella sp. TaxID=2184521 RepID=UPI003265A675